MNKDLTPSAQEVEDHDENCFIAMGGGGMCNCSLRCGKVEPLPAVGDASRLSEALRSILAVVKRWETHDDPTATDEMATIYTLAEDALGEANA